MAVFAFQDLKRHIVDEALIVLINIVIIPHSGWDPNGPGGDTVWSTVFRNSSGILRYAKTLLQMPCSRAVQSSLGYSASCFLSISSQVAQRNICIDSFLMRHCLSRRFQSRSLTNTTNPPLNYRGYSFTRTKLNIFFRPYFQECELGRRLRPQEAARVRGHG